MSTVLTFVQIVVSILFIISVLVQNRGSGLGSAISGQASEIKTTKRGAEKVIVNASIILAIVFVLLSVAFIFVP